MLRLLPKTSSSSALAKAFALLLLLTGSFLTAQASHYRYGSISWQPVSSDPTGRTVQFKISVAYRTSYGYNNPVVLGGTIREVAFYFGDGTSVTPNFTVTSINTSEDWFFGEVTLTHTYATTGNKTAYYSSCCRIDELQNNAGVSYYMSSVVNVGAANRSPVATTIPILNIPAGQPGAVAVVPASDPDGDVLTYSLATSADLGGVSLVQPSGLSINSTTGQLTFNTVGKTNNQLYNAVIKISDGKTAIFVDLIIRISGTGTNPPAFVYTGNATPANGSIITATVGMPVSFSVTAIDNDPGSITLNAAGLPIGSTTAPALQTTGNPVSTVFSWTPSSLGTSVLIFTATDPTANQVSTSVTIQVQPMASNQPPVYNGLLTSQTATTGIPFTYTMPAGTFTDPDGDPLTYSISGLPAGLNFNGGVISGTISSTTGSPFTVTIMAMDPGMLSATGSFTLTVVPTTTTGCGSPVATIGQPLQLLAPTYDCNGSGAIQFNTVGGDGSAIDFQCIPGVSFNGKGGWNTSCVQLVDAEIRTASDAPVMVLQARQNGMVVTYNWDLRAQCPVTRPGTPTPANQSPGLTNPLPNLAATEGMPFSYTLPANTFTDPDGDPMTYTAAGLPMGLHLMAGVIAGTPMMSGVYAVTVTASDGSILTATNEFILTVNSSGGGMPGSFAITGVTNVTCVALSASERMVTFTPQYSGLNGQAITFSVVNESLPTTNAGPYTLRLYTDNPAITLKAIQGGSPTEATYAYNWLTGCTSGARKIASQEATLTVRVLGNPVLKEVADVEVCGAAGESLQLMVIDSRGHRVSDMIIKQPAATERVGLRMGSSAGMYFLYVNTSGQQKVVKLVKP